MGKSRRLRRYLALAALLLVILLAALPGLAGTGPVRRWLAARIGSAVGRSVTVEDIDAGWTSGLVLRGLSVANVGAEYGEEALLEVRTLRVDHPLHEILLGTAPTRLTAEGLVLRLEEHAGGRTNLDDVLAGMWPAEGAPPAARAPPPLRIRLVDSHVRVRRVPPRPRPFDPFREDPIVLPASEGAFEVEVADCDLDLVVAGGVLTVTFDAAVSVNGKGGRLAGNIRRDGPIPTGTLTAKGIDLEALAPLLSDPPRGRLDLHAELTAEEALTVEARVVDIEAAGLREDWVTLRARLRRGEDRVAAEEIEVATASGALALRARGSLPLQAGEGRFEVSGVLPAALAHERARSGSLWLDVEGRALGSRIEWTGAAGLEQVLLDDGDTPVSLDLESRGSWDRNSGELTIEELETVSDVLAVLAHGRLSTKAPFTCALEGSGKADLGRLQPFLAPLLTLGEDARVGGRAQLSYFALGLEEDGDVAMQVSGEVSQLELVGVLSEEVREPEVKIDVDLALEQGGDVLTIRRGRLHEIEAVGHVAGLREGRLRDAAGSVSGELLLSPLLARLASVEGVETLSGRAELDLTVATDDAGLHVWGETKLKQAKLRTPYVVLDQDSIDVLLEFAFDGGAWIGAATLVAPLGIASIDLHSLSRDGRSIDVGLSLDTRRVEDVLEALPRLSLPPELKLEGSARPHVELVWAPDAWTASVEARPRRMTVTWNGHGVTDDEIGISGRVGYAGGRYVVAQAEVLAGTRAPLRLTGDGVLERDGTWSASVQARGMASAFAVHVPFAREAEVGGWIDAEARIRSGEQVDLSGTIHARNLSIPSGSTRASWGEARLSFGATPSEDRIDLDHIQLDLDGATVKGAGSIGESVRLKLRSAGAAKDLARIVPGLSATGDHELSLELVAPLPGRDGRLRADGKLEAGRLVHNGLGLDDLRAEFGIGDTIKVTASAARGDRGAIKLEGLTCKLTGEGDLVDADVRLVADLGIRRISSEELPVDDVSARLGGTLRRRELAVNGTVRFARAGGRRLLWRNGACKVDLQGRVLRLSEIRAAVNGGTVSGRGRIDLDSDPFGWHARLKASDVRIDERLEQHLGLVVPILRLSRRRAGRSLSGLLDAEIDLSGEGTLLYHLQRSLDGTGRLRLRKVALAGSALLPLLSLRRDSSPFDLYRFEDVAADFAVSDGRVLVKPFRIEGKPFSLGIRGSAGLDGTLDFLIRPSLLPVPLRVTGDWTHTRIRPAPLAGLR